MSLGYVEQVMPTDQMRNLLGTQSRMFKPFGSSSIQSRKTVEQDARDKQTAGPAPGQQKTTFIIPSDGFLDPQTVTLTFSLTVTPDSATDARGNPTTAYTFTNYGVGDLINRIRLYVNGGTELENIEYYNRTLAIFRQHYNTAQWLGTTGAILEGWGHVGNDWWTRAPGSNGAADKVFHHAPMLGTLVVENYLPLAIIPQLQIDIWWELFSAAFTSVAPTGVTINFNTGTYAISNLKLKYDIVYFKPDAQAMILAELQRDEGWNMHIQSFNNYSSVGLSGQNFDINFPVRVGSVKSVYLLGSPIAWNSTQYDSLVSNWTGLTSFQIKVNQTLYPQEPILDDELLYKEFQEALGTLNTMYKGGLVTDAIANGSTSLYTIPLVAATPTQPLNNYVWSSSTTVPYGTVVPSYEFDLENDENIISGLSTNQTATDIICKIARSTTTPQNAWLVCFIDKVITIKGTAAAAQISIQS